MPFDTVIEVSPLGFPWQTIDPFLFCLHVKFTLPYSSLSLRQVQVLIRS